MYKILVLYLTLITTIAIASSTDSNKFFNYEKFVNYTGFFTRGEASNDLWRGILRDCSKKLTFSCIQKNAYDYLDRTLIDRDNITIFDGINLRRNNLDYEHGCVAKNDNTSDNLVEDDDKIKNREDIDDEEDIDENEDNEHRAPLEEVTHALREKVMKFLATRNYEVELPTFIASGVN